MEILRSFYRKCTHNKQSFLINILSLVPGLICCLLILSWVMYQVSVDKFHTNIDRIALIHGYTNLGRMNACPAAVGPAVKRECPEVEFAARILLQYGYINNETGTFYTTYNFADADIFHILDLDFVEGQPFTDVETDKCVLSESMARRLFPSGSPVGQFVTVGGGKYVVNGVIKDLPRNSTLHYDALLPINRSGNDLSDWYNTMYQTYVLLDDPRHLASFQAKIKERVFQDYPEYKLYLGSYLFKDDYMVEKGNQGSVYLLGTVALFMLLVACINFVNLSTAGFVKDSFESGIRKVIGATRRRLVGGYFLHVFLLVLTAFVLAAVLSVFCLPFFSLLIGQHFTLADYLNWPTLGLSVVMIVATTLLSGLYPALFLSSFTPVSVLKGGKLKAGKSVLFRNGLVVVQFAISIVLIISVTIVAKQIHLFDDLGYERQEVIYVDMHGIPESNTLLLKQELLRNPAIVAASACYDLPTYIRWNGDGWSWEGMDPDMSPHFRFTHVDDDWFKVLDIKLSDGNFFSESNQGVLINEEARKLIGWSTSNDKHIKRFQEDLKVAGVLKKFLFNEFKTESKPLVIYRLKDNQYKLKPDYLLVRANGTNLKEMYNLVNDKAKEINGGTAVKVDFLDRTTLNYLQKERQMSEALSLFSILSVVISVLGLFGLATFLIGQKRKEIGIRRVNGAKVSEIVWLLNINFLRPIVIAFVIACPVAYYLMGRWLEGYLYRTSMSWWVFAFAGIITVGVAVLTLVWKSRKAATENPVKSLRNE